MINDKDDKDKELRYIIFTEYMKEKSNLFDILIFEFKR